MGKATSVRESGGGRGENFLKGGECKPSSKDCSSDGRNEGNIKKIYNTWEKLLGRFRQPPQIAAAPPEADFGAGLLLQWRQIKKPPKHLFHFDCYVAVR